jgi:hypothetical protein
VDNSASANPGRIIVTIYLLAHSEVILRRIYEGESSRAKTLAAISWFAAVKLLISYADLAFCLRVRNLTTSARQRTCLPNKNVIQRFRAQLPGFAVPC